MRLSGATNLAPLLVELALRWGGCGPSFKLPEVEDDEEPAKGWIIGPVSGCVKARYLASCNTIDKLNLYLHCCWNIRAKSAGHCQK